MVGTGKRDIKGVVIGYLQERERFNAAQERFESCKKGLREDVRAYLAEEGKTQFVLDDGKGNKYSVSDVVPTKITFNVDKLKRKLPRDLYGKVVKRQAVVDDWEGFSSYMKKVGADPKMVLSFMHIDRSVDKEAMDSLKKEGELDFSMLDGCYEMTRSDGYIRVTEMEP